MEPDYHQLASLFPNIAAQMRGALSSLHLAAAQLVPAAQRERDPALDAKAALLDQKVLAGIGNIYADESLFRAGIDPRRPAGELSEAEAERLRCALQEVLRESIAQCGSSIRDYRDANGNVGAFQNTFFVYGRGGQLCRRCGTELEKGRIAGRATVFCPQCQK